MADKNITGIILCGGNSKRMGKNKALQPLGNLKLIEHILITVKKVCSEIIISTNSSDLEFLPYKKVKDKFQNIGPIAGIYSTLSESETIDNIIVNCDTPFISGEFLEFLISASEGYDLVLPVFNQHIQSLTGYFNKSVLPKIGKEIELQHYKPIQMFKTFNLNLVNIDNTHSFFKDYLLFNINTENEYKEANRIYYNISS
jgi:molybdopterin-guanine dinucleotide biosynthesis protein A